MEYAPPPSHADAPDRNGSAEETKFDPKQDLSDAANSLSEILAYAGQYLSAKISGVTYSIKKLVLLAVLGLVVAVIGVTVLVTMCVLLVIGLAEALAAPMPDNFEWLGYVVVGLVGAVGGPLVVWVAIKLIARSGKKSAADAYVERLRRQRESLGTDAALRSRDQRMREAAPETADPSHPAT